MNEPAFALSNSELATYQTCRRKWYLTYYRRFTARAQSLSPVGVASLGSRVHLALESWYGYQLDPLAVLRWDYDTTAAINPGWKHELTKEHGYASAMVEGYQEWVATEGIDTNLDVIDVEHEVSVDISLSTGTTVRFRGKLDQLLRRISDGVYLLRDFKTVENFSKANTLAIDQQMRHYSMLLSLVMREQKAFVGGALYTMIRRSKRTTRAQPPFFEQVEIDYNRHDLNATYLRVIAVGAEIERTRAQLDAGTNHHTVVYPNPTPACSWWCPFVNFCPMMDDGSRWEEALSASFEVGDPYAYLSRGKIDHVLDAFGVPQGK